MNAGEEWTERRRRGTTTAPQQSQALIMASATPVSSEGGTSISARAARGVRGFQHDAESPQVADAVIEAQRGSGPHRCLRHSTCLPLIFPASTWGHYIPPLAFPQIYPP